MKIAITGASGLIGCYLCEYFLEKKCEVLRLSRNSSARWTPSIVYWDPSTGDIEEEKLEGCDVVIHLAGASIAARWTMKHRQLLQSSRIESTKLLCRTLAELKQKPKLLISASAVGFYGNHPAQVRIDELSLPGHDFLARLCQSWEAQTKPAREAGIRVIHMRSGVVLDKRGGALAKMLPAFKMGLGGVLGDGQQMVSWVALVEIPYIIEHMIRTKDLSGAVNVVSPQAVTNETFTKVLGSVMKKPTRFPVHPFMIRLILGEMGQKLLLEGAWVVPQRLLQGGYRFHYDDLSLALAAALK